jgi:G protein-coupled receptor Mth (Methuselah protein)
MGLLISVPFLIVTMLAYCLITELRDLHGKTLVCHILCLTVAYIFLAAVQLGGETLNQQLCVIVAFVIQFSFLAYFFWLNALSFNAWLNVVANMKLQQHHSKRASQNCRYGYVISESNEVNMPKKTERKFFIFYSVYAWCLPLVLVVVSMVFDLMPIIPSSYLKPNFGDNKCWFSSEDAELPYFYGPVAVLICINIVLFICTACRIYCHPRAPRQKPREIFRMCLCLFGVMGINWVMEVVSWFLGGSDCIWYVTDVINTLQGLIIFLIFILEPRVRSCVWRQWGPKLTQILCRSQHRHASVIYRTPAVAAAQTNV